MKINQKLDFGNIVVLKKLHLDRVNPFALVIAGAVMLVIAAMLLFSGGGPGGSEKILAQAQRTMSQMSSVVQSMRRVLEDEQVQELAAIAAAAPDKIPNLQQYVRGRIPDLLDLKLYTAKLVDLQGTELGPYGYAILDMLMTAKESGLAPAQIHGKGETAYLAMAVRVGDEESAAGLLFVRIPSAVIVAAFNGALPAAGEFSLDQYNGRFKPSAISNFAEPVTSSERVTWLRVPGTLLRIGLKQQVRVIGGGAAIPLLLFIFGLILTGVGLLLKFRPYQPPVELREDPLQIEDQPVVVEPVDLPEVEPPGPKTPGPEPKEAHSNNDRGDGFGVIDLPDLSFNLEKRDLVRKKFNPPVELVESIFKAYDIRGVVGETLDAEIARRIGQVMGSMTLEQDAGPVIVARDGRDSGYDLVEGLIEGISSTGCDVIDIGAVPTGVLYYAAYELGSGTGVMVTGSHNPPDYNGFKLLIGGVTQAGDDITGMYTRIKSGNLRLGKGKVRRETMLDSYRERISGDIQLKRPLKVVADCGNGIGGVCAADVLRDIGAEVFPLFDEVDGSFPNHHPDPSEPENLNDLIEAVQMMDADLGIAFDGDADRLGVVTKSGEIIYADRLMMLFAKDVLSREPGGTIIYDVKCTGHLREVIEESGGKPMMYKTGHSLIKNKMKEVDSPFAGEMSGHFFFKERWYGFDCGIYSAARLLEILAADERDPEEVLNSLPNSVSTPELKVHMQEGENHAFVKEFQEKARFVDAKITTIDGLRADYEDGWGLVRASNTTPILVVRFDADSETALQRIKDIFKYQMLAVNDKLDLPF